MAMHVITRKRLNDFAEVHPESRSALHRWYHLLKSRNFDSFAELREIFPEADQVGKLTVFNVGGNKVRLKIALPTEIAAVRKGAEIVDREKLVIAPLKLKCKGRHLFPPRPASPNIKTITEC